MNKKQDIANHILGFRLTGTRPAQVIEDLERVLLDRKHSGLITVATLNPEQVVIGQSNHRFAKVVNSFTVSIADGIGLVWASRLLSRRRERAISNAVGKLAGIDLAEQLVTITLGSGQKVMFLGAKPGVAALAADQLSARYAAKRPSDKKLIIATEGYEDIDDPKDHETETVLTLIHKHQPRLLLVAFGAPFQETWVYQHRDQLADAGVAVAMVVGGSFDIWSGKLRRAPGLLQSVGLEWLWRLVQEPSRFRRQLRLVKFVGLVLRQHLTHR